jgi:hypothetical protein
MKSARPKVLHHIAGRPMIEHVLATAATLNPQSTVIVVGHEACHCPTGPRRHPGLTFVVQEPQLGTGHALLTTEAVLIGKTGTVVLLSGDAPLLKASTVETLVDSPPNRESRRDRGYGGRRGFDRLRANCPVGPEHCTYRRGTGCQLDRTRDPGNQFRHLRLRTGGFVRGGSQHRRGERAAGVLPPGPGRDLPPARCYGGNRSASRIPTKSGASTAAASWRQ